VIYRKYYPDALLFAKKIEMTEARMTEARTMDDVEFVEPVSIRFRLHPNVVRNLSAASIAAFQDAGLYDIEFGYVIQNIFC
jgi:hypothetical protein